MVSNSQGQHLISPRNRRTDEEIQQMRLGLEKLPFIFWACRARGHFSGKAVAQGAGGRGDPLSCPLASTGSPQAGARRGSSGSRAPAVGGGEGGGPWAPDCRLCYLSRTPPEPRGGRHLRRAPVAVLVGDGLDAAAPRHRDVAVEEAEINAHHRHPASGSGCGDRVPLRAATAGAATPERSKKEAPLSVSQGI